MSVRFNPPPYWQQFLSQDFVPEAQWVPEEHWGAPPAGWPMWVDSETGMPAAPPQEYSGNAYLYFSVMPGTETTAPTQTLPAYSAGENGSNMFSVPKKKPMKKGLKIGLWVLGTFVVLGFIGSLGGEEPETTVSGAPEPTASLQASQAAPGVAALAEESAEAQAVAEASAEAEASKAAEASASAEAKAQAEAEASKKAEEERDKKQAEEQAKAEAEASKKAEEEAGTLSQQNALRKAGDYLSYTAFSHSGLVDQLEFEGYSAKDAQWAVDRVNADWNEQAALKAQDYLDMMAFSRSGLIDQLVFEGFTQKQAEYGVSQSGL